MVWPAAAGARAGNNPKQLSAGDKPLNFVLPTPIKLEVLRQWLCYYPDKSAVTSLEQGFSKGFPLQFQGPRLRKTAKCLKSATDTPDVVHTKLKSEIDQGRIAGPFVLPPFPNLQCSPIGLVPKQQPGSFRPIHHLSYPLGSSVNDFVDKEDCKVHYASFDTAVALAIVRGPPRLVGENGHKVRVPTSSCCSIRLSAVRFPVPR